MSHNEIDADRLHYIRGHFRVPARIGARVRFYGDPQRELMGTVTGTAGGAPYVIVLFDGANVGVPLHPTWALEWLPDSESAKPPSGTGRGGET